MYVHRTQKKLAVHSSGVEPHIPVVFMSHSSARLDNYMYMCIVIMSAVIHVHAPHSRADAAVEQIQKRYK